MKARFGAVASAAVLAAALPASAAAHSFLIRSEPQAGSRLNSSPGTMTLAFSEPFVRGSKRVSVRRIGGGSIKLAAPQAAGAVIRQALPPRLRGVFVVSWRVLSDDGHISLGEFAFAVGASAGALPTLSGGSGGTPWSEDAASWVFFVGLALALGGLVSEGLIWRRARIQVAGVPAAAGLLLAALASLWLLILIAGAERGGGFGAGLSANAFGNAIGTRPGTLTLVALAAVVAAAPLLTVRRTRTLAIAPLLAALVATALRGHSGTANAWWAAAADVVHLAGVALWVGALAHLVLAVARAEDRGAALASGVRSYSRLALPTALLVIASGIATAIPEFRSLGAVVSTSYGRTLLIKAGLIGVALLFALAARRRALPANPQPRWLLLRRLTGAEAAALVAVLGAVAVLVNSAPPRSVAASQLSALGPPPLGPAVRLADLAGQLAVGIAATERELQFTIVPPSAQPKEKVKLTVSAVEPSGRALDLFLRPCGPECFTIRYALRPGQNVITAQVGSSVWRGGRARFVIAWPARRERPGLVRRIAATMRRLPSLRLTEAVTSDSRQQGVGGGYHLSGRQFMQTEVFGGGGVDVRVLGRQAGLTEIAFAIPGSNIWYRVWIDRRYRLRRELIVDAGHLIRRSFSYGRSAPTRSAASPPPPNSGAPTLPAGSFALGQQDGDLAVGLAARPAGARLELEATVLGPDGSGLSNLDVAYTLAATGGVSAAQPRSAEPAATAPSCLSWEHRGRSRCASPAEDGRPRASASSFPSAGRRDRRPRWSGVRQPSSAGSNHLRSTSRSPPTPTTSFAMCGGSQRLTEPPTRSREVRQRS